MANTYKLNWLLKKLLSSCYSSRKNRQIDDSRRIGSHSGTSDSKGSGKEPVLPPKSEPTTSRPAKLPRSPNANAVRMHPLVRGLDSSKKSNRSLPLAYTKQRRDNQLAKSLGSQESGVHAKRSSPIPLKVLDMSQQEQRVQAQRNRRMCWRESNDSVVTRNIEKMVRDSQARLLNQRVKELFEKRDKKDPPAEIPKKCQEPAKTSGNNRAVEELLKTVIGRENMASKEKGGDKDVRISRMQTKLEWDGKRPARRTNTEPSRNTLQTRHAYHMRIVCFQARKPRELSRKSSGPTRNPKARPTFNLAKEEQKRLDILKAEWVQLKGLENNARYKRNCPKGPKKPTDTDAMAPTDLDLKSLIVDPKSFLTKVHVKSKILSVNLGDHFSPDSLVENPDVFSNTSKMIKFGDESEGKDSETNLKEELPKVVPH